MKHFVIVNPVSGQGCNAKVTIPALKGMLPVQTNGEILGEKAWN
jgi:hypothetical protein